MAPSRFRWVDFTALILPVEEADCAPEMMMEAETEADGLMVDRVRMKAAAKKEWLLPMMDLRPPRT